MTIGDAEDRRTIAKIAILFVTAALGVVASAVVLAVAVWVFLAIVGV